MTEAAVPATAGSVRTLKAAAATEAASLALLLANVFTVHNDAITSFVGPLHGTAYLLTIGAAFAVPRGSGARGRSLIPGVGGLLALARLGRAGRAAASAPAGGPEAAPAGKRPLRD